MSNKGHYVNYPTTETVWEPTEFGIVLPTEKAIEKREKMKRWEWKAYFAEQEITMEEFLAECKEFQHLPHGHM